MVPLTRRRLLHGTVALLAATAGCNESTTDRPPTETESAPSGDSGATPESYALRNDDEEPPVWIPNADPRGTTNQDSAGPPDDARRRGLVASDEMAERTWFADVDGADEARQFVADTDFESETLYVEFRTVRECYTVELCSASWSKTEIDTEYGSYVRDADVSCRADAEDGVSWLIRIPEALDPDSIRSRSSGWSSNGCRRQRRRRERSETTTEAPDFGPESPDATETTAEAASTAETQTTAEDDR